MSTPKLHELHYEKLNNSVIRQGSGYFLEPLNILAKKLNFTLLLMPSIDGQWGAVDERGKWNGLISMLINDQTDIAVVLTMTEERQMVVDFSNVIDESSITLLTTTNLEPQANRWVHAEIFPETAWYVSLAMVTGISMCFAIINYSGINNMHKQFDSEHFTILNGLGVSLTFLRQI